VEYRVLGPTEVVYNGQPGAIAAGKQRELLCCLLVAAEDGEDGASPAEPAAGAGGDDARALAGQ